MERQKGPIVIDNKDIPTYRGSVDVVVDQKALREYIIEDVGDTPDTQDRIDQLVIAFGKRSFRDVLTENITDRCLRAGFTETKALKQGRREAAVTDILHRLILDGPVFAVFHASNEYPFLYFNLPYILRTGGDEEFYDSWAHELDHLSDYLKPKRKAELMRHQNRMYNTAGAVAVASFVLFEKVLSELALSIEDPFLKATSLAVATGISLHGGAVLGSVAFNTYYSLFHMSEKKARITMKEHSETRNLVELITR